MDVWPGQPVPLGATYDGTGTNFAVYSEVAESVELCLFDDDGNEKRVELPEETSSCWHGHLPGVGPGQRYGFRVHGPWNPKAGHLANPAKLLLDPYARAVWGEAVADVALLAHAPGSEEPSDLDSAPFVPKAVVDDPWFDWGADRPPQIPAPQTVLYEADVRALTARHPDVPDELRGTYAGLAHPAVVAHLTGLGVTAVNLPSVQQFVAPTSGRRATVRFSAARPIGFFAPHNGYGAWQGPGQTAQEFRHMVKALHDAGLEVLIDVAIHPTAESGDGPLVLSFRGLDNAVYYGADALHGPSARSRRPAMLELAHPAVLRLVMDSLRHWVENLHVDGFRFRPLPERATVSAPDGIDALWGVLAQDPVLSRVKLVADPGPAGWDGRAARLPPGWLLCNHRYGGFANEYWGGQPPALDEVARRIAGSPDLHGAHRPPYASVNLVDPGGGVPTAVDRRRSLLALLFVSQGIPEVRSGFELADATGEPSPERRTGEPATFDWERVDETMVQFIRRLASVRRRHPLLHRSDSLARRPLHGPDARDFTWFHPSGAPITEQEWAGADAAGVAVVLNGDAIATRDQRGEPIVDTSLLLLLNAAPDATLFTVPAWPTGRHFVLVFDSAGPDDEEGARAYRAGDSVLVEPRSAVLLRLAARRPPRPPRTVLE